MAYNIHQLRAEEKETPKELKGDYARVQMTLVDASTGVIRAKRIVRMGHDMTQALRQTLEAQMQTPFSRSDYETLVQQAYARYPNSDAMLKDAVLVEAAEGEN